MKVQSFLLIIDGACHYYVHLNDSNIVLLDLFMIYFKKQFYLLTLYIVKSYEEI